MPVTENPVRLDMFQEIVDIGGPAQLTPGDPFIVLYASLQWWGATTDSPSCSEPRPNGADQATPGWQSSYELKGPPMYPDGIAYAVHCFGETQTLITRDDLVISGWPSLPSGTFADWMVYICTRMNMYYNESDYLAIYGTPFQTGGNETATGEALDEPFVLAFPPGYYSKKPGAITLQNRGAPFVGDIFCWNNGYGPRLWRAADVLTSPYPVNASHTLDFSGIEITFGGDTYRVQAVQISDSLEGWGPILFYCAKVTA